MPEFSRYAIYFLPDGAFGDAGAHWLGWDARTGMSHANEVASALTQTPRAYGFHATLKAPFYLAQGVTQDDLIAALEAFCKTNSRAQLGRLSVRRMGGFFALTPQAQDPSLTALASSIVREFDPLRAPVTAQDLERRRQKGMRPEDEERFMKWGYPHVFERFRFHITLTGNVPAAQRDTVEAQARAWFAPHLEVEYHISELSVMGQAEDGNFVKIQSLPLQ